MVNVDLALCCSHMIGCFADEGVNKGDSPTCCLSSRSEGEGPMAVCVAMAVTWLDAHLDNHLDPSCSVK